MINRYSDYLYDSGILEELRALAAKKNLNAVEMLFPLLLQVMEENFNYDPDNICSECDYTTTEHCPHYLYRCVKLPQPINMIQVEGNGDIDSFLMADTLVSQLDYNRRMGRRSPCHKLTPAKVSLVDGIFFCNKKSISEAKVPAYRLKGINNDLIDPNSLRQMIGNNYDKPQFWVENLLVDLNAGYRLPTEKEFRYAANGAKDYSSGYEFIYAGSDNLDEVACINSKNPPEDIREYKPNSIGIYGCSGYEWNHLFTFNDEFKAMRLGGSYSSEYEKTCAMNFKGCFSNIFSKAAGIRYVLPANKN